MATARLIPSTYYLSSSTYLSVSNAANMYANTDSDTYATVTNSQTGTTSYYIYLRGFNFGSIPSNAVINSFSIKLRARESGVTTSTSYYPRVCNGTSTLTGSCSMPSTTVQTLTFSELQVDYDDIKGYGDDFGIRINCRRASRNTTGYMYIYGAEIEVNYTVPNPRTITTTLTGNGSIDPSGTETYYDGDEYNLSIIPTNSSDAVSATKNGTAITLTHHAAGSETVSAVPSSEFTTGFSDSGADFYQSSSVTSTSWLEYAIGHSAESPYSTSNTNNTYVKPSGETGWINYHFDFSDIPAGATITSVSVKVYGAREDATVDSTHVARFQCYSGNTAKGTLQNFTSTSNGAVTVTDVGTWTAEELYDAQLRFELGYYGGRMLGITWTVTYTAPEYYSYSYIVDGDATIVVVIGSAQHDTAYVQLSGRVVEVTTLYKKVNGVWATQTVLSGVFDPGTNYKLNT